MAGCSGYCCRWISDHLVRMPLNSRRDLLMFLPHRKLQAAKAAEVLSEGSAKLGLLLVALGVFVLTVLALVAGLNTLSSNAFFYYSKFAWEQWFPSFFVIMVVLMLLSLVAMATVFFAGFISGLLRNVLWFHQGW
ncbi:unnamed protein product [Cladocopium goreaui]|uniref:Uncharacterized protein n=1 Tax=Cladocopium goreaui TaxID=2562237 RepID=A0A9P1DTQ3_9DINO|nr:unnamed protein product [Cladocopium goreaui]